MPVPVLSLKKELKTTKIEIDPSVFKECTSKVEKVWNWFPPKNRKFLIHFAKGKFIVYEIR